MCFYHDYDWYAQISERSSAILEKPTTCDECRRLIAAGQTICCLYQQQYEECQACENGDCECGDGNCCVCAEPEYGETFGYECCPECEKFLQAVAQAEVDAGCESEESRPALGEMIDDIREGGQRQAKRYWKAAAKLYPELVSGGYLGWLWKRMFWMDKE